MSAAILDVRLFTSAKGLQVGEVNEKKERLLEGIVDPRRLGEEGFHFVSQLEAVAQRRVGGPADAHGRPPQAARELRVGDQSVGEEGVDVPNGPPPDVDFG